MKSPSKNISLPVELWHEILAFATQDLVGKESERWIIKYTSDGDAECNLFRALSLINRATRAWAMSLMWTDVFLHINKDPKDPRYLRQLIKDLSPVEGPLPGPRHYIESLKVRTNLQDLWKFDPENETEKDSTGMQLRELSERLIGCPNIHSLTWDGWIEPDPTLLINLSQARSLRYVSVDLDTPDHEKLRNEWHVPPAVRDTNNTRTAEPIWPFAFEKVHFAVEPRVAGCPTCYWGWAYGDGNELDPEEGEAGVALLTKFRFARTISLGAPLLLYQEFMVPVWAQLERLEFDPYYYEPWIDETGYYAVEEPRDPKMDERMLKTAQVFPSVLDSNRRIQGHLSSRNPNIGQIAKRVYSLIKKKPELRAWWWWFSPWTRRGGSSKTRRIMRNVAEVLVDRSKFNRPQREKYSTAAPRGYICQRDDDSDTSTEISEDEFEDDSDEDEDKDDESDSGENEDEEGDSDEDEDEDDEGHSDENGDDKCGSGDAAPAPSEAAMSERDEISDGEMDGGEGEVQGNGMGRDDTIPDCDETVWEDYERRKSEREVKRGRESGRG